MNTFLPFDDFQKCAEVLDYRRLGKQRVEAMQILNAIETGKGWINHPITKMWTGYENALKLYHDIMIKEWIKRGYRNTMKLYNIKSAQMPWWMGFEMLHLSHRASLSRKMPEHYAPQFGSIPQEYMERTYAWTNKMTYEQKRQVLENRITFSISEIAERLA
jgi:hypothetical protein